jgi:hypothetical protein
MPCAQSWSTSRRGIAHLGVNRLRRALTVGEHRRGRGRPGRSRR